MNFKILKLWSFFTFPFFLFLFTSVFASGPGFRHIQSEDGLDGGDVIYITHDNDGIIWLATTTGIVTYDGLDFTNYRPDPGNPGRLPAGKITAFLADQQNNLWIATGNDLVRYVKQTDSFVRYGFENPDRVMIKGLAWSDGNLLIHTTDDFFYIPAEKINTGSPAKRVTMEIDGELPVSQITKIISFDNNIYIIKNETEAGSAIIYKASMRTESDGIRLMVEELLKLENNVVNCVDFALKQNLLFIGTGKGIYSYSPAENKLMDQPFFAGKVIHAIKYTSSHKLFFTTDKPELFYIDLYTGIHGIYRHDPYQPGTLLNLNIKCLHEDFSGNLWAGHQEGLTILDLYPRKFKTWKYDPANRNSLSFNNITAIAGNGNVVFIGSQNGGLFHMSRDIANQDHAVFTEVNLKLNNKKSRFSQRIWDIERINNSEFLAGTEMGLLRLHKENGTWILEPFGDDPVFSKGVRKIMVDKKNNIWCSLIDKGLILIPAGENNYDNHFFYTSDKIYNGELSDCNIISMAVDSKGRFWLGTNHGIKILDGNYMDLDFSVAPGLKFGRYNPGSIDFLENYDVNCIYENTDGSIWFATQGSGIIVLHPDPDKISSITKKEGLLSDYISGILPDEAGNLWISSTMGLMVYNRHGAPAFYYYTREDGLQGNRFITGSFHKLPDGEMFFGGNHGFTAFYPQHIKPNESKPRIVFTNLAFGNRPAEIGETILGRRIIDRHIDKTEKIILPFKHRMFSIGVAAIHYQNPVANKIMYRLQGYDEQWKIIPAYYRNIYFSNLPAGRYTLEVKAVNSNNITSSNARFLIIDVLKPWYLKWFTILGVCILFLLIAGVVVFIFFNRQKILYLKKINSLTIESEKNRTSFLTGIANSIKTPLSLVIAPIDDLIQNNIDIRPDLKNDLLLIRRNARYLSKLINQITNIRSLNGENHKLLNVETNSTSDVNIATNDNDARCLSSKTEITRQTKDSPLKIVIVEDNTDLRNFLKRSLSGSYLCYEASNGEEGLEMIREIIPDIVISDIVMPEKDGFELCKNIKDNINTCHIPVILLTALNMQKQIISGYEVGADAYVTKPFDIKVITAQISRLIKNRELIRKKYHDQNFMVEVPGPKLSKDDEFLSEFITILKQNISDPNFNVTSMAGSLNVSSTQLYRKIKALTGYSPVEFLKIVKLQKSYELLLERKSSVKEVCYLSGFNNISYFIKCFRAQFGLTPAQVRDNGVADNKIIRNSRIVSQNVQI
jgi:DNA-binding response OmpR family regulator/ligand-binding sensor domain-containing protein